MKKINAIKKYISDCTQIPAAQRDSDTRAYLAKHIAKLPDTHPVKSVCMKLLAGEEVECEDITPFLDGLKQNKRLSPISFLYIWAIGRMRLSEREALEASTALATICEKQFLGYKSTPLWRSYKRTMVFLSPAFISIAVLSIWKSHIIAALPPSNYTAAASLHFKENNITFSKRITGLEYFTGVSLEFMAMWFMTLLDKPYLTSLYREEIISSLQLQSRPETVSTLIERYLSFPNPNIGSPKSIDDNHLKTLLEIMTISNVKQITYNGSVVMERFDCLIRYLNGSTLEYTPEHMNAMLETELMSAMLETVERTGDSSLIPVLKEVVQTNPYPWIREAARRTMDILIQRSSQQETLLRASDANVSESLLRGSNPLQDSDSEALLIPIHGSSSSMMGTEQHETMNKLEVKVGDGN